MVFLHLVCLAGGAFWHQGCLAATVAVLEGSQACTGNIGKGTCTVMHHGIRHSVVSACLCQLLSVISNTFTAYHIVSVSLCLAPHARHLASWRFLLFNPVAGT